MHHMIHHQPTLDRVARTSSDDRNSAVTSCVVKLYTTTTTATTVASRTTTTTTTGHVTFRCVCVCVCLFMCDYKSDALCRSRTRGFCLESIPSCRMRRSVKCSILWDFLSNTNTQETTGFLFRFGVFVIADLWLSRTHGISRIKSVQNRAENALILR